jgi:putative transposase
MMLIQKAYKFELRPDGAKLRAFASFAGAARFVWNYALAKPKYLGYGANSKELLNLKVEFPWLREAPSQVLQQSLMNLDRGWKNFFTKRTERPSSKKKSKCADSFRFPQGFKVDEQNSRILLPKIGWVRYRNSRRIAGKAKSITISRKGDRWFASIQTELEVVKQPIHPAEGIIGIDLGISRFATASDGSFVAPLNALKRREYRLRRYQRRMARKKKFCKNWKKAKSLVQKQYQKVGDSRRDFLQKASTKISKNHAIVVLEDLKVSNMSASASGTLAKPGKRVRQKSRLNKAILDQGWSELRRMLEYKQSWAGGLVIAVPAMYTSQTCPACRHRSAKNRTTQAVFACVECGYTAHADYVGACNILAAGHAVLACGGDLEVRGPMKQEPTERAA